MQSASACASSFPCRGVVGWQPFPRRIGALGYGKKTTSYLGRSGLGYGKKTASNLGKLLAWLSMKRLAQLVDRRLNEVVRARMATEPVVVLSGPRAVGKSTLLRSLAEINGRDVLDLDDLATRDAVASDPAAFVSGTEPQFIDEFQHVPDLLDAIKAELNRASRPGRFIIAGSTRYETLPATAQSLTGRIHRIDVRPLSQGEIEESQENFVESLLTDPAALAVGESSASRSEYYERVLGGGFPLALQRSRSQDRSRWFDDYIDLVLERDVLELSKIRQRRQMPQLLKQLASQTASILNVSSIASTIGMDRSTAENYVKLLEAVFLIELLPAWGTTLGSRVAAAPKVHVADSGLAARLLRLTEQRLMSRSPVALTEFGHLLETFLVGEIVKQLDWLDMSTSRGHWRTHDGDEVDLVIERDDGMVVAVEVKAAGRVLARDLRSLRRLRDRLGSLFLGGVSLYLGTRAYTFERDLHVVPLDRLWLAQPSGS